MPPRHEAPTESFLHSLRNPRYIEDGGVNHAVYSFNEGASTDEDTPPLAVFLPYENGTASQGSCSRINALATHMDRPIVVIDLPATGQSDHPKIRDCFRASLDSIAETSNRVLDKVGLETVDFMGICMGGAIAARAAVQRGERARSLVTFATPGFDTDLFFRLAEQKRQRTAAARRDSACDQAAYRIAAAHDNPEAGLLEIAELPRIDTSKTKRRIMFAKLGLELLGKSALMQSLPEDLAPTTYWYDFVGREDTLTTWQSHSRAAARRNQRHPGTARVTVLKDVGHDWPRIRTPVAAHFAEQALRQIN